MILMTQGVKQSGESRSELTPTWTFAVLPPKGLPRFTIKITGPVADAQQSSFHSALVSSIQQSIWEYLERYASRGTQTRHRSSLTREDDITWTL